jgi:alpha-tubulin suppressor-like RCC1 family protein
MQRFVLRMWYSIIAVFIILLVVAPASAVVGVIVKKVIERQAVMPDTRPPARDEFVAIDPMPAEDVVAPSTQQRVTLSSGAMHSCVVAYSGQVLCWGANDEGQLGSGNDGTALSFSRTANSVAALQDVTSVAVGLRHSCALVPSPGTVWCWGSNASRQIGQAAVGPMTSTSYPQVVTGLERVVAIAAGNDHTCARGDDGAVRCWGANNHGQLGTGQQSQSAAVQLVPLPEPSSDVYVGGDTTCALLVSTALYCWGSLPIGEMRDVLTPERIDLFAQSVPTQLVINTAQLCAIVPATDVRCWSTQVPQGFAVPQTAEVQVLRALGDGTVCGIGLVSPLCWDDTGSMQTIAERGVIDVSGGLDFQCITVRAGRVRCRGDNRMGQLASTRMSQSGAFVSVALGDASSLLSAGAGHVCGMWQLGMLRCWGRSFEGQLGVEEFGGTRSRPDPITPDINGVLSLSTGAHHTCAVRHDERVFCWGANTNGQLGSADTRDRSTPTLVNGVSEGVALSAGAAHTCLLQHSGTVWCWGDNRAGQVGGSQEQQLVPVRIDLQQPLVAITSGGATTCGLQADGLVICWGAQIGKTASFVPLADLTDVTAVSAGNHYVCALRIDGAVWCWGDDNMVGVSKTPQRVEGVPSIRSISAGGQHACAVDTARRLWCWGANQYGQVDPNNPSRRILEPLQRSDNIASVAAGFSMSCARNVAGSTSCWGDNQYGQLADEDPTSTEVRIDGYDDGFSLVAGGNFSCALLKYVSVRCWGNNEYGQLGDGTTTSSAVPQTVRSNEEIVRIAAGSTHACSIILDGTVRCWGHNNFGQLGNEASEDSSTPVVAAVQDVVDLSLGQSHSCALLQDGGGACWGRNEDGQLGSGNTANSGMPLRVADLEQAVALASGGNHTCALTQNTQVSCWGRNEQGQLGIGTVGPGISVPASVPQLVGVTAISAGTDHTCALADDGSVWCWGWNRFGQTAAPAIGEKSFTLTPSKVPELGTVIAIHAGGNHTCALQQNGRVRCWGDNYNGQLGAARSANVTVDARGKDLVGFDNVIQIATGGAHTCTLQQRGNVRCWGWNRDGQLGTGTRAELLDIATPAPIVGLTRVTAVALGDGHLCAVDSVGTVWCWGENDVGQLGIGIMGNLGDLGLPNEVDAAVNTVSVDLGANHSCALLVTAELNCWGRNYLGQLGNSYAGDIADSVIPNFVVGMRNVSAYSAGGDTSCAVSNGFVSCWGDNEYGQLGTATVGVGDYRTTATLVAGIDAVVDVTIGTDHVCALRLDQTVWCWGRNNANQVDGTSAAVVVSPTRVALTKPIKNIGSNGDHTCAVDTDGSVWCWGNNQSGQLSVVGDSILSIQRVDGIPPVQTVVTGSQHSCALDLKQGVWCWGNNQNGQLGIGETDAKVQIPPTQISTLTGVVQIAAAGSRSCALLQSAEVWCWGENTTGQLGVSPNPDRHAPAVVQRLWSMRASAYTQVTPTALPVLPTARPTQTAIPSRTPVPTRTLIRVQAQLRVATPQP